MCRWLSQVSIKEKSTVVGVIFAIFGMLYPSLSVLNLLVAIISYSNRRFPFIYLLEFSSLLRTVAQKVNNAIFHLFACDNQSSLWLCCWQSLQG